MQARRERAEQLLMGTAACTAGYSLEEVEGLTRMAFNAVLLPRWASGRAGGRAGGRVGVWGLRAASRMWA